MFRLPVPLLLAALIASGCGGDESSGRPAEEITADAHLAASNMATYCGDKSESAITGAEEPKASDLNAAVDKLIDVYRESNDDIRTIARDAANRLRDCDEDAAADRINAVIDSK